MHFRVIVFFLRRAILSIDGRPLACNKLTSGEPLRIHLYHHVARFNLLHDYHPDISQFAHIAICLFFSAGWKNPLVFEVLLKCDAASHDGGEGTA